ncbi:MAG: GNAT family N-acetyltransferase [Candidatus Dormibacteraeota bacterium]|uniref:GNAT family N-acetyltransferase n=1 Tax=Candidatus Amunia macphersoniae TaxID=3127014 RepID=A0A934KFH6_9BACT|nr:GNAT family N-acetyltransferase [Candidatus Dormibacteraeota bacterium]
MPAEPNTRTSPADERHGHLAISVWSTDDADEMGAYWSRNRDHLAPTQPGRAATFWTVGGQRFRVEASADEVAAGRLMPLLVREDGDIVGDVILSNMIRGAFCSGSLGYNVDGARLRRGIATWAVGAAVDISFADLNLHRLQAGTLLDNVASQGVLRRCGFERIGVARDYLAIAGEWRDHVLWQRVDPAVVPPTA